MNIADLVARKKALKLTNKKLADLTGIPVSTINKILGGVTKSPGYDTLLAIEDAIGKIEKASGKIPKYEYHKSIDQPMMVRETSNYALNTRKYTEDDINNLPEGDLAELIDGVLLFKGMPSLTHERIISKLSFKISDFIQRNGGSCEVFSSHYAMRLQNEDDETNIFLPDIMVVCNKDIMKEDCLDGAADWIIEVVSPGTSKNDYQKKVYHYRKGGIREYWIIDPIKNVLTVFDFNSEKECRQEGITIYSWDENISSMVFTGLEVCMADLI